MKLIELTKFKVYVILILIFFIHMSNKFDFMYKLLLYISNVMDRVFFQIYIPLGMCFSKVY
jgi:hypothetical protein